MAGGRRSFSDYGIFKNIHIPILVFQTNTLRRIYNEYHLTRVDFLVLSAGFTIQKNSLMPYFDNPDLSNLLSGVGHNVLYKSLRRLLRRGIVALMEKRRNCRRFYITPKGLACINAFTQYFNSYVAQYKWHSTPEFTKLG